jgi:hypothetical protein
MTTGRAGAYPGKLRQPAFFCNEIGEGRFQREDGGRGPFIAKHLRLCRLRERRSLRQPPTTALTSARLRGGPITACRAPKGRLGAQTA